MTHLPHADRHLMTAAHILIFYYLLYTYKYFRCFYNGWSSARERGIYTERPRRRGRAGAGGARYGTKHIE